MERVNMRYGAMNFPVAPILAEISDFGKMKMDYLELAMDPPQAHYHQIRQQKSSILRALERFRMGLVCHLPTFVYTAHLTDSIRHASIDEVTASLETAADLGADKVVVHPGYIDGLAIHVSDHALDLALESLGKIYLRAETLGVKLCIENMFPLAGPFAEPDDFIPIFQSLPGLKLVLDTGHATFGDPSGKRIEHFITQFRDRLEHLHMSDNCGNLDSHLPLGHGNIGFRRVAGALRNVGYDKTVTLEIFDTDRSALLQSRLKLEKLLSFDSVRAEVSKPS
jgi:sugar phosphate isomerase/epimerase